MLIREELSERAEVIRQAVRYFEVGRLGGVGEGQIQEGRTGGGRVLHRGLRSRSEQQSVQDLEQDVFGELLPATGAGGGDTEAAWRGYPNVRGTLCVGSGRSDGGSAETGREGRGDLPLGLLRLPSGAVPERRGRGLQEAVLEN